MRLLASVLALGLLVSGCTLWKQPKNPSWNNATGSEQYERLMWKSIQEKNWKDAVAHMAPMFVGVSADGRRFDRAGWIEHWKNIEIRDLSLGELTVQSSGADMVVTYELHLQASGIPAAKGFLVVSVWQQLQRGWVLTAQSTTLIQ